MKTLEIEKSIQIKRRRMEEIQQELSALSKEVVNEEKLLKRTKVQEREGKETEFFKSIGLEDYVPNTFESICKTNRMFIVFTKKAEFVKLLDENDFRSFMEMEAELEKEKLYAHRLSSFRERSYEWYDWSLKEKLKNLLWALSKYGNIITTD